VAADQCRCGKADDQAESAGEAEGGSACRH
jgi:hypothetical protein